MATSFTEPVIPMITTDERFFKDLGARVAQLRKDQCLLAQAAREQART